MNLKNTMLIVLKAFPYVVIRNDDQDKKSIDICYNAVIVDYLHSGYNSGIRLRMYDVS